MIAFQLGYWYHFLVLISLWQEIQEPPLEVLEQPDSGAQVTHWHRQQVPGGQAQVTVCMPGQNPPAALAGENEEEGRPPAYNENYM